MIKDRPFFIPDSNEERLMRGGMYPYNSTRSTPSTSVPEWEVEMLKEKEPMVAVQTLAHMELFEGLPDRALSVIATLCQERSFAPGETILSQGHPADQIYLLQEGTVGLFVSPSSHPAPVNVSLLDSPGQTFGWSAIVRSGYYTATVQAVTDVHAIGLDGHALLGYLGQNAAASYKVMRQVVQVVSYCLGIMRTLTLETVCDLAV